MEALAKALAKWFAGQVQKNPKLNPIPHNLFKAALEKQIEAMKQKGREIKYDALADAVCAELAKS